MTSIANIVHCLIRITYRETERKPTKLFIGPIFLRTLNDEIMQQSRYVSKCVYDRGFRFMELEVITKDQFGNELPPTYIGVV